MTIVLGILGGLLAGALLLAGIRAIVVGKTTNHNVVSLH
jgi:hypothetical protein